MAKNKGNFKLGAPPHNKGKREPHTERLRMIKGLSGMAGFATGLTELDIPTLIAGSDDLEEWVKTTRKISRILNRFAKELQAGVKNAAERTEHQGDQSSSEGTGGPSDRPAAAPAGAGGPPGEGI